MRSVLLALAVVYLAIGLVAGWGPLLVILGSCTLVLGVVLALDDLHEWRRSRAERRAVCGRWDAWWFTDEVRRRRDR